MPKVSVIIPTYERPEFLKECLESFANQTYKDFEVVVVDDGSIKDNLSVVQQFPFVRYEKLEHTGKPGVPRNRAFELSCGEYIMVFDDDDIARPELIETAVNYLDTNKDIDVVYFDYLSFTPDQMIEQNCQDYSGNLNDLLDYQIPSHSGATFRRNMFFGYDDDLTAAEDWTVFLRSAIHGAKFGHVKKHMWLYRIGHSQLRQTQKMEDNCEIIKKRYAGFRKI